MNLAHLTAGNRLRLKGAAWLFVAGLLAVMIAAVGLLNQEILTTNLGLKLTTSVVSAVGHLIGAL